jgi:hypothetical protein
MPEPPPRRRDTPAYSAPSCAARRDAAFASHGEPQSSHSPPRSRNTRPRGAGPLSQVAAYRSPSKVASEQTMIVASPGRP